MIAENRRQEGHKGAKALSHRDGKAQTHADAKTHDEELDACRRAYGGKGLSPQGLSHNGRIDKIIGLLEEVPHEKRQTEFYNKRQDGPLGHILSAALCHTITSFLFR